MQLFDRPHWPNPYPRRFPRTAVHALLETRRARQRLDPRHRLGRTLSGDHPDRPAGRAARRRTALFVLRDGQRITRGTCNPASNAPGPRPTRPRRPDKRYVTTYATELAAAVNVYTQMKHESMATWQRYVTAAGTETRSAAARNPLYAMISTDI